MQAYALDNGILVTGEEEPALTRRYLVTALTALGALSGTKC